MIDRFYNWIPAAAGIIALSVWPFGRGKSDQPDSEEPAQIEDQPAELVIDHMDWGIRLGTLGRFERAAERFEQAVAADPDDPSGYYNLALALDQAGNHEQARDTYNRALEIDSSLADIHTNLGIALYDLGNTQEAVKAIEKAVQLDPSDPIPPFDLGCIYLAQKEWSKAIAQLRDAVKADPKDAQTRFNLAIALRKAGSPEDAEPELRDYLVLARGRFPEQREFATSLLSAEYDSKGDLHAP